MKEKIKSEFGRERIHQKGERIQELSEEGFGLGPGLGNRCLFENKHPAWEDIRWQMAGS